MLVVGSTAFDTVAKVDAFPAPDRAVEAESVRACPGGCGANVARALARLGREPTLLSAVGADFRGSPAEAALREEGVDLSHLERVDAPTARAILTTDEDLRQAIVYDGGATPAMRELAPVEAGLAHFAPGELAAYPPLMAAADRVVFDPGQEVFYRPTREVVDLLDPVDVLVVNEHEAAELADEAGSVEALASGREAVIVTRREGQVVHAGGDAVEVEAAPADVVDPTGAGDAYAAGLVHGLAEGRSLVEASRLGGAVAACAVEALGAQAGLPTLAEARARAGLGD